jgi:hypothetical protein
MEQAVLLKPTSLNRLKYCPELYLSRCTTAVSSLIPVKSNICGTALQSQWWAECSERRPGLAWPGVRSLFRIKVKRWP